MKIEELEPGMKVIGGIYKLKYEITEITGDTCTVVHHTGGKRMHGGKWVKETYEYTDVDPIYFWRQV